jgi:flagellar hook assembly protein FlgD
VNLTGQIVRTFNLEERKEGQVIWDGTDDSGKSVASGVYFVRAGKSQDGQQLKLIYLK